MNGLMMKYFVLNPNKKDVFGKASRMAMLEYAKVIDNKKNHSFAEEIRDWVLKIQVKNAGMKP